METKVAAADAATIEWHDLSVECWDSLGEPQREKLRTEFREFAWIPEASDDVAVGYLGLAHAAREAERKAVEDYRSAERPLDRLRDRIYGIIAATASCAIDNQPVMRGLRHPPSSWTENFSRTAERLLVDPLFHRLVSAQTAEIIHEVERYEEALRSRLSAHAGGENASEKERTGAAC